MEGADSRKEGLWPHLFILMDFHPNVNSQRILNCYIWKKKNQQALKSHCKIYLLCIFKKIPLYAVFHRSREQSLKLVWVNSVNMSLLTPRRRKILVSEIKHCSVTKHKDKHCLKINVHTSKSTEVHLLTCNRNSEILIAGNCIQKLPHEGNEKKKKHLKKVKEHRK